MNSDTPTQSSEPNKPSIFERIADNWFVSWILVPLGLILFLHYYIFSAYNVVGTSMIPTLQNNDYLIISKVARSAAIAQGKDYIPARNQVVVFHFPKQPELDYVKRVIGVPGDRVVVKDGNIRVYNETNPEGIDPDQTHEVSSPITEGDVDLTVPAGNIFVVGDNRLPGGSYDSRAWGLLPSSDIVGKVVIRLYPFNHIQTF